MIHLMEGPGNSGDAVEGDNPDGANNLSDPAPGYFLHC